MNEMLDGIKATLYKHYQTILERDGYVTAEKVRNTFLGKEEKAKTLLQVFAQHNEQYALKVGKTATHRTYTRYELTKNRLAEYIRTNYHVEDISFREINPHELPCGGYQLSGDKRGVHRGLLLVHP